MKNLSVKKILLFIVSTILQLSVAFVSLAAITTLFYINNWSAINAFGPMGTDSFSAFTYVEWINRYFPNVPFWYPVQGAGVSFIASYPFLAHYIVVAFHRFTDISLMRSFNIVEFSAFLISAIGIFVYCWTRLEYPRNRISRQIIGLVAAGIYLIAPITYVFAIPWGFYAETVSYIFVTPTLILLDYFIDKQFKGENDWKKRFALLGGMVLYTITFLTHFSTGVGITHFVLIIIAGRTFFTIKEIGFTPAIKRSIVTGLCIFLSLLGLFAWRYMNFQDYSQEVAKGGFAGYANPKIKLNDIDEQHILHLKQVLGLEYYSNSDHRRSLNDWAMQPYVWIFALLGATIGAIRSRKMALFGLMALYGLTTLSLPLILFILSKIGPFAELFNARSVWTVYRVTVPILAAYGIYTFCELPFLLGDKLIKKAHPVIQFNWDNILKPLVIIPCVLAVAGYAMFINNHATVEKGRDNTYIQRIGIQKINMQNIWKAIPQNYNVEIYDPQTKQNVRINVDKSYTPEELYYVCKEDPHTDQLPTNICDKAITKVTDRIELLSQQDVQSIIQYCDNKKQYRNEFEFKFCNILNKHHLAEQLNPLKWPTFDITKIDFSDYKKEKEFFSLIPDKPLETRFDLSGFAGSIIMRAPLLTTASQTQVYINNLSLFSALWNYQSSVMYSDQPINQKPGVITEIAKYFGYEYIYQATNSNVAKELFDNDPNWENTSVPLWRHFKTPTTLTTWTSKPAVLFIGNEKSFLYDQFFKISNLGVLPYDDATLFAGKAFVDEYTQTELAHFDVLILEGYKYHNPDAAHQLLDTYVKNGGNIFIDTGWRYESPDWELKNAPTFFPTNNFVWKEVAPKSKMVLDQSQVIGMKVANPDIGFLSNFESQWGISAPQDIREGSHVIMHSNNVPIIVAKEHGKGRVIWSGMNIIPHIEGGKNENEQEIEVLKNSIQWLLANKANSNADHHVLVERNHPDKVKFTFTENTDTNSTLYWRESYYPKWHAYLTNDKSTEEITTYRAGPRLTGMRLPKIQSGQVLTMRIETTTNEMLLNTLAGLTLVYLLLYAFGATKPIEQVIVYYIWKIKNKRIENKKQSSTFKMHENPEDGEEE